MFRFRKSAYTTESDTLEIGSDEAPVPVIRVSSEEKRDLTKRVLLLDDQADFREVLQDYLASYLFQVTAVNNGAEGLREIMNEPFDLIICDMMMPKLNGEMFYWAVTRMRPAAGQRFIFITGHQTHAAIESFFKRVNAVVLIKPFKLDALLRVVHEVFARLR
jgi:DNA-binding NtrC family response regulator